MEAASAGGLLKLTLKYLSSVSHPPPPRGTYLGTEEGLCIFSESGGCSGVHAAQAELC